METSVTSVPHVHLSSSSTHQDHHPSLDGLLEAYSQRGHHPET